MLSKKGGSDGKEVIECDWGNSIDNNECQGSWLSIEIGTWPGAKLGPLVMVRM